MGYETSFLINLQRKAHTLNSICTSGLKLSTKLRERTHYTSTQNIQPTIPGNVVRDTHVVSALLLFFSFSGSLHTFVVEG
jgi:hypothetical protein